MRSLHRDEGGGSTVELAIALPLLLLVLLGAVQFGLVVHARSVTQTAAVEGARAAAAEGRSLEEGAARTRDVLESGLGATGQAFTVEAAEQGEAVVVEAHGSYPLFIPWVTDLSVPLEATAEVWREDFRAGP